MARHDAELRALQKQAAQTRNAIEEVHLHAPRARAEVERAATAAEAARLAAEERQETARRKAAVKAEQARHEEERREAAARAETARLAIAARLAAEHALKEVVAKEHHRALEAARLLKIAQDAEQARVV